MDSVSVLSYLTGKRRESVRGLLLHLESETDMRSTHGKIIVAKRRCTLTERLNLIFRSTVFFHVQNVCIVFCTVAIHGLKIFKGNSAFFPACFSLSTSSLCELHYYLLFPKAYRSLSTRLGAFLSYVKLSAKLFDSH